MDVSGKVCVVTGAAGGIGAALAGAMLERGARVAITDLDAERLDATRVSLAGGAAGVVAMPGDAARSEDIAAVIAFAERELGGPVEVYVANAGVGVGLDLADEAGWATAIDVNLMAHVRAAQQLVPGWVERGRATSSPPRRQPGCSRRSVLRRTRRRSTPPWPSRNGWPSRTGHGVCASAACAPWASTRRCSPT